MQLQVLMIRNGVTEAEQEDKLIGITDEPLSKKGIRQAKELARVRKSFLIEQVYTSSLLRCRQTVDIVFPGISPIQLKNLQAQNYGVFEGIRYRELPEKPQFLDWAASFMAEGYPGGESPHAFGARCVTAFRYIVEQMSSEGVERVAVVTHQSVINHITQRFCVPRNIYHNVALPHGKACWASYDTGSFVMKIRKAY